VKKENCKISELPKKLKIGYASWGECDELIYEAVENGLNVVIWFSLDMSSNANYTKPEFKRGPNFYEVAKMIKDNFLQQNSYTPYDRYCPFYKTRWMIRNLVLFYELGQQSIEQSSEDHKITWATIKTAMGPIIHRINSMKFELPSSGEEVLTETFRTLYDDIQKAYRDLRDSD